MFNWVRYPTEAVKTTHSAYSSSLQNWGLKEIPFLLYSVFLEAVCEVLFLLVQEYRKVSESQYHGDCKRENSTIVGALKKKLLGLYSIRN